MDVLHGRDEVARLTQAFDRMTRDLVLSEERLRQSERVAAWREIARRIAHEIKNPLSPIQISIETLRKAKDREHKDFDALFSELTATVLEEVQRMKRIVSEFSDFARMPAPRPQSVDLVELVGQVVLLMREGARGRVEVELEAGTPETLSADPDQLRQSLMNLIKNAIEAVEGDPNRDGRPGRVKVSLRGDARGITLAVEDNGPGMSAETRQRIFTPYFTTKTSGKVIGTGLGLPIVQRIVEEHGGRVHVESTLGVGTRFEVWLPRERPAVSASLEVDAPLFELRRPR
jgi:nitrogen fixation/metabolism regulation signal transduction histidine kinase